MKKNKMSKMPVQISDELAEYVRNLSKNTATTPSQVLSVLVVRTMVPLHEWKAIKK